MKLGSVTNTPPSHEEPNVAPLIDIVFILLIFFVVTTTFARDLGIDVERPSAGWGGCQGLGRHSPSDQSSSDPYQSANVLSQ